MSVPTVQGLALLFAVACYRGTDKLGQVSELDLSSMLDQSPALVRCQSSVLSLLGVKLSGRLLTFPF